MLRIDEDILRKYEEIESKIRKGVALYGAGQNGRWCLRYLKNCGLDVKCFYDSAKDKARTLIGDIPVLEWQGSSEYVILVTAKHCAKEILTQIGGHNIMSFDAWYMIRNLKEYDELHFEDPQSDMVKTALQRAMISGDESLLQSVVSDKQYFCLPQFWGRMNETFVDLGAYVGDTVEKFIDEHNGCFYRIYAFEPGERQNKALRYRCERLRQEWALSGDEIVIEDKAVGERHSTMHINTNPLRQSLSFSHETTGRYCESTSLDEYFANIKITFLKADIEGMEMEMLKGGEKIIRRDKPKIAICVYHCPDDLLEMCKLLKAWVPEYKLSLRQHSPQFMETVLYCYL